MRDNIPSALRGASALQEALGLIGGDPDGDGDKKLAKVIVDAELDLANLLRHFLNSIAEEI